MAKFIQVTDIEGTRITINTDKIIEVRLEKEWHGRSDVIRIITDSMSDGQMSGGYITPVGIGYDELIDMISPTSVTDAAKAQVCDKFEKFEKEAIKKEAYNQALTDFAYKMTNLCDDRSSVNIIQKIKEDLRKV